MHQARSRPPLIHRQIVVAKHKSVVAMLHMELEPNIGMKEWLDKTNKDGGANFIM